MSVAMDQLFVCAPFGVRTRNGKQRALEAIERKKPEFYREEMLKDRPVTRRHARVPNSRVNQVMSVNPSGPV